MAYHSEHENNKKYKKVKILLFCAVIILLGMHIVGREKQVRSIQPPSYGFMEDGTAIEELSQAETSAESIHQGLYYYECLTETEKCWYEEMFTILDAMQEEGYLPLLQGLEAEEAELDKIFQCLMNDHPELFFVKGYTYTRYTYAGEIVRLGFTGMYTMDPVEREEKQLQIEAQAEQYLQGISTQAADYEKVKYVYETIVTETEYQKDAQDSQNIYSVFVNHESVCQGYAKAAQYLLMRLGVDATLVKGTVYGGENHAWNLVWIDGTGYYMDATWGDASYRITEEGTESVSSQPDINYDYLCVTTEQIEKTHIPDSIVPLPECMSMDANYYVREGAYFTDYEETALADFFERGYADGKADVTLKCANREIYELFCRRLIEEQEIFNYLDTDGSPVAYAQDIEQLSLTFWLVNE